MTNVFVLGKDQNILFVSASATQISITQHEEITIKMVEHYPYLENFNTQKFTVEIQFFLFPGR